MAKSKQKIINEQRDEITKLKKEIGDLRAKTSIAIYAYRAILSKTALKEGVKNDVLA